MQGQSNWPCNMIVRMMNRGNWKIKDDKEMTFQKQIFISCQPQSGLVKDAGRKHGSCVE